MCAAMSGGMWTDQPCRCGCDCATPTRLGRKQMGCSNAMLGCNGHIAEREGQYHASSRVGACCCDSDSPPCRTPASPESPAICFARRMPERTRVYSGSGAVQQEGTR